MDTFPKYKLFAKYYDVRRAGVCGRLVSYGNKRGVLLRTDGRRFQVHLAHIRAGSRLGTRVADLWKDHHESTMSKLQEDV